MSVGFIFGAASDVGQLREVNQDSFLTARGIAVVADGMGGHRGGEIASAIAVRTMQGLLVDPNVRRTLPSLCAAVGTANDEILAQAAEDPTLQGMGTTLCAVSVVDSPEGERLGIVNVGDSRVYRFFDGELEQITEDHSLVEVLVRQGRITPEEAQVHPQRNIVTRALGVGDQVEVDRFDLPPVVGTRYLLCSDGLFNEVTDLQITQILSAVKDPDEATRTLIRAANEHGGRDNITTVIADVVAVEHPSDGGPIVDAEGAPADASTAGDAETTTAAVETAAAEPVVDAPGATANDVTADNAALDTPMAPPAAPGRRWWQRRGS